MSFLMEELSNSKKRVRGELAESEIDLPEVKKFKDDLLAGFLDESDSDPVTQDLDSVMKSFEVEISACSSPAVQFVDLTTSDSGESQPELGYLLEASDDELGLPPSGTVSSSEEVKHKNDVVTELERVSSGSSGIGDLWGFEDPIPSYSYDTFGLGIGDVNSMNDYVAFDDGLFEYSNVYLDSAEISDFSWRHETLPAE